MFVSKRTNINCFKDIHRIHINHSSILNCKLGLAHERTAIKHCIKINEKIIVYFKSLSVFFYFEKILQFSN